MTARAAAFMALLALRQRKRHLEPLLDEILSNIPAQERALCNNLVYTCLRQQLRLEHFLKKVSKFARLELRLQVLLTAAAGELGFFRTPSFAAVHDWVQTSKVVGLGRASGLVNAALRAWLRRQEHSPGLEPSLLPSEEEFLSVKYSHPRWLVRQWLTQFGPELTCDWLKACQLEPRASIRVNLLKTSVEELLPHLAPLGEIRRHALAPDSLLLSRSPNFLPGFAAGCWQAQDPGSSAVAPLLAPAPGSRVLDMCAGIGGKTGHLAGLMQNRGELLAVEISPGRAQALEANLRRLGVRNAKVLVADACQLPHRNYFDYILLDAPCSGLGVTRRRPDLRWRRRPQDLPPIIALQKQLLRRAVEALKPGGFLLYATCTTAEAENSDNINWLLQTCPNMGISWREENALISEDNFWRTYPQFREADGFFAVRLQKGTGKCCK